MTTPRNNLSHPRDSRLADNSYAAGWHAYAQLRHARACIPKSAFSGHCHGALATVTDVFHCNRALAACGIVIIWLMLLSGCDSKPDAGSGAAGSFAVDQQHIKGPLIVHVKLDRESISITQTVNLRLEAEIEPGYHLEMPSLADVLGKYEFGILDYRPVPDRLLDNKHLLLVREYRLEPILSGDYTIGALTFRFSKTAPDEAGAEPHQYELITEEIPVEVTSLLDEERDDLTLADIRNVAPLPRRYNLTLLWIAVVAGALLLAVIVWLIKRKRTAALLKRIFQPAHELAYQRLHRLEQEDLIAAGRVKEFYGRVSGILRHYIEDRFEIKAPEQTTEEFLAETRTTDRLTTIQGKMLHEFLVHCDQVKFARYAPSAAETNKTFTLTREFIDATRAAEVRIDVTDQAEPATENLMRTA